MPLSPTDLRSLSEALLETDAERALSVARNIPDPWFRCQALATAGRVWTENAYSSLLKEAVAAADSQDDVYKRVAVAAWPIRAYLERGDTKSADRLLARYTPDTKNIKNMGGRSEAIMMLFQAARPFNPELWQPVFLALVQATEPNLAWRQRRNIRHAFRMVSKDHPYLVRTALKSLTDQKTIARLKRDFESSTPLDPRSFF